MFRTKMMVRSFTADKNSGQGINTNINLTATAGNGMIPYQYKFYFKSGSETKVLQDFTTTNTTIFKPTVAGDYTLFVEVKDGTGKIASESMVMKILDEGSLKPNFISFLGKDPDGNYYQYNVTDFNNSYLAYQINPSLALAKMYQQFLNSQCRIVGLEDQVKGYMDYNAAESASLMAQIKGEAFDINAYFARNDALRYEQIVNNLRIVDKDGNIKSGPNATVRFYSSLVPGTKIVVVKLDTITPADYTVTYNGVVLIYDTLLAGFKGSVTMDVSETLIPVVFETH